MGYLRLTIGMVVLAYSLDRVSVVLVVEEANCLIRLACANNDDGGGDPTSVRPTVRIVRLCRKPPESTDGKESRSRASGIGRAAQWARAIM